MRKGLPRCVILGGGGHAAVLIDALEAAGEVAVHGILDRNPALWNTRLYGHPVLGADELLAGLARGGIEAFVVGVGSVTRNPQRRRLYALALDAGLQPCAVRHPSAVVSPRASVGRGSVILAGAIVNAGARIGENVIVNSGAIIEHECEVGDHVHVASGARLSGGVRVAAEAFIGAGATLKQQVTIGEGAVVGAGSVVLRDVAPACVVVGAPARRLPKRGRPAVRD